MAAVLKTARARKRPRGFESHALRSTPGKTPAAPGNPGICGLSGGRSPWLARYRWNEAVAHSAGARSGPDLFLLALRCRRSGNGCAAPSLLCCLTGDAESVGDLRPGVANSAQPGDRDGGGMVDFLGQSDEIAESFDVTGCDAATVSGHDSPGEGGVVVVLHAGSSSTVSCQGAVDAVLAFGWGPGQGSALPDRGGESLLADAAVDRAQVVGGAAEADLASGFAAAFGHNAVVGLRLGVVEVCEAVGGQGLVEDLNSIGVVAGGQVRNRRDRPADARILLDGDAELGGDVAEPRVVVAALAAGVLDPAHRGDAVRGFVQQRAQQRHGSSAEAFAADEQLGQPVGADGPFLVVEVSEGRVAGFAGAVAQGEHDVRDLGVLVLDRGPGGFDRGYQGAGHGAVRGLTLRCQRGGHELPPV